MIDVGERLSGSLSDRYRIERELGQGGMATVYLAHDLKHDRDVAIKVLRPELAVVLGAERFLTEIRTTARLQHPHILPLLDSGQMEEALFFTMPFVRGGTLRGRLDASGALPWEEAVAVIRGAGGALEHAHRHGVVHRDVKPENVLLHEGVPMVADFGIALAVEAGDGARLTQAGVSVGTPAYMSPEQIMGERPVDGRSDQYGLACVLYEMITGMPLFKAASAQGLAVKHLVEEPPRLADSGGSVPDALDLAVARALSKDPDVRFPTVSEFLAALGASRPARGTTGEKALAVLPFDNVSPDAGDAYLAEGLTDEIIADLSRLKDLSVISRSSAAAIRQRTRDVREVARLLDVTHVLEGSVRRAGDRLRITAQLSDGSGGTQVWAEKYNGSMDDVFAMQEGVSRAIVEALEITLTPSESDRLGRPSVPDVEAFERYLEARAAIWAYDLNRTDRVLERLRETSRRVGPNPLLLATEGWLHFAKYNARPSAENPGIRIGLELAQRARSLDPTCALAWFVAGWGRCIGGEGGFVSALPDLRRAVELDPSHADAHAWLGFVYACLGREAEAERAVERAGRLDPVGALPRIIAGWGRYLAGRPEEARVCLSTLPQGPDEDWISACVRALFVLAPAGRQRDVVAVAERWSREMPGDMLVQNLLFLGHALSGDRDRAMALFTPELRAMAWHGDAQFSLHAAQGLALAGEVDEALALLEHAVDGGFLNHAFLAHRDPLLAPLRGHPRFQAVLALAERAQMEAAAL